MPIQSAQQLLIHELQSIQDAEAQAARALKAHLEEAEDEELCELLERRLQEGEHVLQDVRKSLDKLDGKGRGVKNKAARGLIEEAEETAENVASPEMKDAVIIAGAQKLEHYCIAAWGTVKAIASELEEEELAKAMQRALDEGYRWDEEMSELAEGSVNPTAIESEEGEHETTQASSSKGKQGRGSKKKSG
jgi:ferritin-like metal-binding protein YciE